MMHYPFYWKRKSPSSITGHAHAYLTKIHETHTTIRGVPDNTPLQKGPPSWHTLSLAIACQVGSRKNESKGMVGGDRGHAINSMHSSKQLPGRCRISTFTRSCSE